jgi:hypothetical protein
MTTVADHDHQRAERIATAQRSLQAWEAERERVYRTALDAADRRLAAAGPWRAIDPHDQPRAMAEAHAARAAWEARNPEPAPPEL